MSIEDQIKFWRTRTKWWRIQMVICSVGSGVFAIVFVWAIQPLWAGVLCAIVALIIGWALRRSARDGLRFSASVLLDREEELMDQGSSYERT